MARDGSLCARAIEHLQSLGEGARLSSEDLAAVLGYEGTSFSQCLAGARKRGELVVERDGRAYMWSLPEPEDDTPPEFNASLWMDGDLIMYGVAQTEDGGVLVTKDQLARLKKLIAWSPAA